MLPKFRALQEQSRGTGDDYIEAVFQLLPELAPPIVSALADSQDVESRLCAGDYWEHAHAVDPAEAERIAARLQVDDDPKVREHITMAVELSRDRE